MPAEHGGGFFAAATTAIFNSVGFGNRASEPSKAENKTRQSNGNRERTPGKKRREAAPLETREALPPSTKPNPSQRNQASEDELRICGDFRQPLDAVFISIPTPLPSTMPSQLHAGNFRPRDTLHQGPQRIVSQFFPGSGLSSQNQGRTVDSALTKKPHLSRTKVCSALDDNEFVKRKRIDLTEANESSRKRQRVDSPRKSLSPSSLRDVSVGSGNRLNPSIEREVRRMDPSEYISFPSMSAQTTSQRTINSGHPRDRQRQNEYQAVESLVNPRTRKAPPQSARIHDDSIDDLSKEASAHFEETDNDSNPISWSMIDDDRASDAGAQAPNSGVDAQMALQLRRAQRCGHQSRKVTKLTDASLSRSPRVLGRGDQHPLKHGVIRSNGRAATRQAEQIRYHTSQGSAVLPTRSDRRPASCLHTSLESHDNSIDELAHETTVDCRASFRPVTRRTSSEEKPTLRIQRNFEQSGSRETQSLNDDEPSSSDVQAADFIGSKKPRHASHVEGGKLLGQKPLFGRYNVRKLRIGNWVHKAAGCALRYRPNPRRFVLENEQREVIRAGDEGLPLVINPANVFGGIYSEVSPYRAHLLSGPSGTDLQWVDIIFSGAEDVVEFMYELHRRTPERIVFEAMSPDEMARMRSQMSSPSKTTLQQDATGLTLPQTRVGKRENGTASNDVLRPRKRSRQTTLVSQLQPERVGRKGMTAGNYAELDDEILYDNPKDNNTRGTQAQGRSNGSVKTYGAKRTSSQKSLALELDLEVPDDQKYSIVKGLGVAWKKPVVFPADGPKKMQVTVDFEDLYRLDEGEFLNDTLIQFYLRFCEVNSPKQSNATVLLFNTYFYTSLTTPAKGKRGINYDSVKRWTAKLEQSDIFNYDFVVVPVNENAHWYLAIICNLTNINRTYHADESEEPPSPIASMDFNVSREANDDSSGVGGVRADEVNDDDDAVRERYSQMSLVEEDKELPTRQEELIPHFPSDTRAGTGKSPRAMSETRQAVPESNEVAEIDATPVTHYQPEGGIEEGDYVGEVAGIATKRVKRKSGGGGLRKYDPDQPMIITLDSLGCNHPGTVKNLKDYLVAEAREKRSMDIPDGKIQGITAKGIPGQANYCDCGLFLLGYAAKFLQNPRDFVRKVAQREFNIETDWPELNPSDMRNNIRSLLQMLYAGQSGEPKAPKDDGKVEKEGQQSAKLAVTGKATGKALQVLANGPSSAIPKDESRTESPLPRRVHRPEESLAPDSKAYASCEPTVMAVSKTQVARSSAQIHMAGEMLDGSHKIANLRPAHGKEHNEGKHETEINPEDDEMLDKGPHGIQSPTSSPGKGRTHGKGKLFGNALPMTSTYFPPPRNAPSSPSRHSQPVVIIESPPRKAVQSKAQTPTVNATNNAEMRFADEPAQLSKSNERRKVDPVEPAPSMAGLFGEQRSHPPFLIHVDDSGSHEVPIPRTPHPPLRTVREDKSTPPRPPTRGKQ